MHFCEIRVYKIAAYEMQGYGDTGLCRCIPMGYRPMQMHTYGMQAYEIQGLWGCRPTEIQAYTDAGL
jgi:hypothetical protein